MKAVFSPTRLIATVAAILLLLPATAQWNNISPNGGHSIKFVSATTGYLQSVYTMQKTTNGGTTWTTIDSVSSAYTCEGMYWLNANDGFAVFSENLGFGNYAGWFKKTTNGGASWTTIQQVSATSALYSVWFTSATTGYVVGENGTIRMTVNGGTSWTTLPSTTSLNLYTIQFVNATTGWAAGDDGIILKTVNSGSTWTQQFQSIFYEFLDVEFTDPLNGCATGSYGLMRTTNGGANWNPITVYGMSQFLALDFPSADTGYMTGVGGNIFRTIDGGATWLGLNRVTNMFVRDVDFITNDIGFVTVDYTGTWQTTNAGSGCPSLLVQNTVSLPDTIYTCAGGNGVFSAMASALNNYTFSFSPASAINTTLSYGQYYYTQDTVEGDTLTIAITMTDPFTGCSAITDAVVLITDSITYTPQQPTQLFLLCPGDSLTLDLGANAQDGYYWLTTGDTTQTITIDTVGSWSGMAYACGGSYGIGYFIQWDPNCTQVCAVDAGPDTTFCQLQGQLNATPASPGSYTFTWSPAYGLDDPNIQNPTVVTGVHNQQYIVTMTDTANNCVAMDTVVVNAYYFHVGDTSYICNNSPVTLDFGPGGSNYIWQFFTDTAGNTSMLNQPGQTITVTQPGQYMGIALYPACGALTSVFTVVDSCNVYVANVWPGDCNYDLIVNMADALHIGLGYGATGTTRPAASNAWFAQPMNDWTQNYVNCNYKHGDADGNGTIDVNDTVPVALNYSLTHPFRLPPPQEVTSAPSLQLVCTADTVGLQTLVQVDVVLGSAAMPMDSLYGISFRITSESGLIDTNLTAINANASWLGTTGNNMFTFQKHFPGAAVVDFAEVKNNHINTLNGNGVIATFFIVTTDNLSGIAICNFDLSDVTAVTASQHYVSLTAINDSVVIDPSVPAGVDVHGQPAQFSMYPNPANENVTVQTSVAAEVIEICDMSGRVVKTVIPTSGTTQVETASLAAGMYFVNVKTASGVLTQKLTISR